MLIIPRFFLFVKHKIIIIIETLPLIRYTLKYNKRLGENMITLDTVYKASHALKDVVRLTDIIPAKSLSEKCELFLKTENLQLTGSFKLRGAYYKMSLLTEDEKARGVVACSAGNHAQGVALAAQKLGITSTIFLPATAPLSKVEATEKYGAIIKLIDGIYDDAYATSIEYQKETSAIFLHPFDDENVIAGQATIALEILEQLKDVEAVIVPVGGGGLISGIAYVIKSLKPHCKVYGVQSKGAASMRLSLDNKKRSEVETVTTFADGIAVKKSGEITFQLCSEYVDDIVTVSDDEIATAILTLMEKQKLVAEGAGAAAVAAILFDKIPVENKKVCAIVSGGNIDVNILSRVIHRGLMRSGRLSELTIELIDKPGQLKDVTSIIASTGANIIGVLHDRNLEDSHLNDCTIQISLETKNHAHIASIKEVLIEKGYKLR